MRKLTLVFVVAAMVALAATCSLAQDIRSAAMGETAVGLANGSDAWWYNPAGLPFVEVYSEDGYAGEWRSLASGTISLDRADDENRWEINYSGRQEDASWGIGGGWWNLDWGPGDDEEYGLGFGLALDDEGEFSIGASVLQTREDIITTAQVIDTESTTSFIVGGLLRKMDQQANLWQLGVVADDVTEEFGTMTWRVGASVTTPEAAVVAFDLWDATDEFDSSWSIGAEYPFEMGDGQILARAGLLDGDATVGAAYRQSGWELGLSYMDAPEELAAGAIGYF